MHHVEKLKVFMYEEVYFKLIIQRKSGNCKNIYIYFDKPSQQFINLKKLNKKFQG